MRGGPALKIRVWPVLISFVVTFFALFGGYYLYESYALQSPLHEQIAQIDGVALEAVSLRDGEIMVTLELEPGASLRAIVEEIETEGRDYIKDRELTLNITNASSERIDQWWASMLFDVAEAMEQKQYSTIPQLLAEGADSVPGLQTFAEMDEQNVYICLMTEDAQRFITLPRIPVVYSGWSNE